jgi:primase-polymerase (primpol)-like protein
VDPRVLKYIERFQDRYVEASVSGTGVHLITRGKIKGGTKKGKYELYDQDRFFTLTGMALDA